MLLVIDVGNTNTVLGVFDGLELRAQWRLKTDRLQTADEYGILTRNLFTLDSVQVDQIDGIMAASVVPGNLIASVRPGNTPSWKTPAAWTCRASAA